MALSNLDQWLVYRMGLPLTEEPPSSAALRQWQLDHLRTIVAHAQQHSPFYARHLQHAQTHNMHSLEDFSRLPMVLPEQLQQAPEQLLCVSQDDIARVVTLSSSGTTGQPKRVFHTRDDLQATVDFFRWGMANMVAEGDTVFVLMPGNRPGGVGQLLGEGLASIGATTVLHGVLEHAGRAVDHLLATSSTCIVGPAHHVHLITREWQRRNLPKNQIRSVLLCWDAIPKPVADNVTEILGAQVFRHWGMIETGLGGAVDCCPDSGMHLRETDVFLEIVDPATGHLLPDGEQGEIVVSTPLRYGMPLIRYRTGDMGRILPGECSCTSPLRRLDADIYRIGAGVWCQSGVLRLKDFTEVLLTLPDLWDFSVCIEHGVLHISACGTDPGLKGAIRYELDRIPVLREAFATGELDLDIQITNNNFPIVPGLGKRKLYHTSE